MLQVVLFVKVQLFMLTFSDLESRVERFFPYFFLPKFCAVSVRNSDWWPTFCGKNRPNSSDMSVWLNIWYLFTCKMHSTLLYQAVLFHTGIWNFHLFGWCDITSWNHFRDLTCVFVFTSKATLKIGLTFVPMSWKQSSGTWNSEQKHQGTSCFFSNKFAIS